MGDNDSGLAGKIEDFDVITKDISEFAAIGREAHVAAIASKKLEQCANAGELAAFSSEDGSYDAAISCP